MRHKLVRQILVVDYTRSAAPAAGVVASTLTIPAGQAAVIAHKAGNITLSSTSITSHRFVKVAYHSPSKGQLIFSDEIDMANVTSYTGKIAQTALEQIYYIGYNGSTGSIQTINSNLYKVGIEMRGTMGHQFNANDMKWGVYQSDASATQAEIANGIVENMVQKYPSKIYNDLKFETINDGSITSFAGGAGVKHISVTKGDSIVTFSTAHGISTVGSFLKIAGITYKVKSVPSTTTLELTIPYQGDSGYVISAGATTAITATVATKAVTLSVNHGLIVGTPCKIYIAGELLDGVVGATALITVYKAPASGDGAGQSIAGNGYFASTPTNWGIKITGEPCIFEVGMYEYCKNAFSVSTTGFGTTTLTDSQAARLGTGVYEQVAMEEYFCQGYEDMFTTRQNIPNNYRRNDANVGSLYSQLTISWNEVLETELGQTVLSPKELVIYAESSQNKYETIAATYVDNSIKDASSPARGVASVLDAGIASTYHKGTAQVGNL